MNAPNTALSDSGSVRPKASATPIPFAIAGIGQAAPAPRAASAALDAELGLPAGTVARVSGRAERRFVTEHESPDDLQRTAANQALNQAGIGIDDIDCLISASATARQALPFNAAHVCRVLGARPGISAFDIDMTCLSALRALETAAALLPRYPNILIVSCEIASAGLDWQDPHSAALFGDGAAAMVVRASDRGGLLAARFAVFPEGYEYCAIPGCGYHRPPSRHLGDYAPLGRFRMDGRRLYQLTARVLPGFLRAVLEEAGLTLADLDWVAPHQASPGALDHMRRRLGIPARKLVDIFQDYGNQVAASLPNALFHLLRHRPVQSGDRVLLIGTSAGLGLGALIWELP